MKLSQLSNRELREKRAALETAETGEVQFSYNDYVAEIVRRRENRRDWCLIVFGLIGALAAAVSILLDWWEWVMTCGAGPG